MTSTQTTLPARIAATVRSTVSQPMSFAKWLKVPAGKTAERKAGFDRDCGGTGHGSVSTPDAKDLGPACGIAQNSFGVIAFRELDNLRLGELFSDLVYYPSP